MKKIGNSKRRVKSAQLGPVIIVINYFLHQEFFYWNKFNLKTVVFSFTEPIQYITEMHKLQIAEVGTKMKTQIKLTIFQFTSS